MNPDESNNLNPTGPVVQPGQQLPPLPSPPSSVGNNPVVIPPTTMNPMPAGPAPTPQQPTMAQPIPQQNSYQNPSPYGPSPSSSVPAYTQQSNTKSNLPKIIIIVVVALLLLGAIGFGASKLFGDKSTKTQSSGVNGVGGETTISKSGKVGSTLDLDGLTVTVLSVEKKTELDKYVQADAGKVYYVANVTVKNGTKDTIQGPTSLFTAKTSKGEILSPGSSYPLNQLAQGIAPGGETSGYLAFQVLITDTLQDILFEYKVVPVDVSKDIFTYKADFTL